MEELLHQLLRISRKLKGKTAAEPKLASTAATTSHQTPLPLQERLAARAMELLPQQAQVWALEPALAQRLVSMEPVPALLALVWPLPFSAAEREQLSLGQVAPGEFEAELSEVPVGA